MLSLKHLEPPPHPHRPTATVAQLADRDPALLVGDHEDVAHLLQEPAFGRVGRAAVVDASGHPVGVVSITDVQREVRARHLGERGGEHDGFARRA